MEKNSKHVHYSSIDGLRALSCLGIILMHIRANTNYNLGGNFIFDRFIPSLTELVYLFLIISGFGMCVGYLNKFQTGSIDLEYFYKKRYKKILPFFAFLLLIALVMEHDIKAIYEASIEALLLHGLLPNNAISVIGVAWTLGVIFLFYLLFPAFTVLMRTKRRAWLSLIVSIWVVFVCIQYFFSSYFVTKIFTPRHSFIFCLPMFIIGGIVYLYRIDIHNFCSKYRYFAYLLPIILCILWYFIPSHNKLLLYIGELCLFGTWLSYAVGIDGRFLSSRFMKFLSGISMEMYLAQMIIFRLVEKLNLLYIFGNSGLLGWISYLVAFILTVVGLIIFIYIFKFLVSLRKYKANI